MRSIMRHTILVFATGMLIATSVATPGKSKSKDHPSKLEGLTAAATISRDIYGIAHIKAGNDHDLYFLQGYVHARDRLFQMDVSRRRASGTLAELLGPAALAGDVELRTIGIRRAAASSLLIVSSQARAGLQAYSEGVNAYVVANPALPPEYQALEITKFAPWTLLDTMTVAKSISFGLSFGLDDIQNTVALQTYAAVFDPALGEGTGATLFSEDLWRSQPFYPASTIPDASVPLAYTPAPHPRASRADDAHGAKAAKLGRKYTLANANF